MSPANEPVVMNAGFLSPQAETRLAAQATGAGADLDSPDFTDFAAVAVWRAAQHEAWGEGTVDGEIDHEPIEVAGRSALAAGPVDAPVVLHLHAGGWSLGSPGTDAPITARMAAQLRVISLDYRLAPEHPFPAALDDAEAAYRELAARHERVSISGISAGGNLAIGVARRCIDAPPAGLALLCPHVDLAGDRTLLDFEQAYVGAADRDDPWVSPSQWPDEALRSLPPTLVHWTDTERMAAPIEQFARRLAAANPATTACVWQGLWHAWHYHRELPEAWAAVDGATSWLCGVSTAQLTDD